MNVRRPAPGPRQFAPSRQASLVAAAVIAVVLLGAAAPSAVAVPQNDDFADAIALTGLPVAAEGSNEGATSEPGEPSHANFYISASGGHSVWWRWTAPISGHVAVQTCGSSLDTALGVYVANGPLATVEAVESHMRGCIDGIRHAFFATAGTTYYVAVDGRELTGRTIRLQIVRAGSVSVRLLPDRAGGRALLVYRAAPGDEDELYAALDWDAGPDHFPLMPRPAAPPFSYWVQADASLGPGCRVLGDIECEILRPFRSTGPLVYLGDSDDFAEVGFSRAGTHVFGGTGDDTIKSGGRVRGGPGNDTLRARAWSRSQLFGGRGDDEITGSAKRDIIVAGPGMDRISTDPDLVNNDLFSYPARDVVRTRDGEIDVVTCTSPSTVLVDGVDATPWDRCVTIRRGAARAVPFDVLGYLGDPQHYVSVLVQCPDDAPPTCKGLVTVSRRGSRVQKRFKMTRGRDDFVDIYGTRSRIRRLNGRVRITVRTRDRQGILRTASGIFENQVD